MRTSLLNRPLARRLPLALTMFALALLAGCRDRGEAVPGAAPVPADWGRYHHQAQGITVHYPRGNVRPVMDQRIPGGRLFVSADGALSMRTQGHADDGVALRERFRQRRGELRSAGTLSRTALRDSFYVLSGEFGDEVRHEKWHRSRGRLLALEIAYPRAQRAAWDSTAATILHAFPY